jgi:hypothetical protein
MSHFVKLIGELDVREQAWRMSRPYIKPDETVDLDEVSKTDLSLHSMNPIVMHIKSSIAFREIIATLRPHGIWAQTSRVTKISDMEISSYVRSSLRKLLMDRLEGLKVIPTEVQDKTRLELPAAILTEYYVQLDFRTWISLLKFLEQWHPTYFYEYGRPILDAMNMPYDIYNLHKFKPALTQRTIDDEVGITKVAGFYHIVADIPLALRAQLVRHQSIIMEDEYIYRDYNFMESLRLKDKIRVRMTVRDTEWDKMMSHRACWIAQFELYEDFFKDYMKTRKLYNVVPCDCLKEFCPFKNDVQGRIDGRDPGLVCPAFSDDPLKLIDRREELFGKSTILDKYRVVYTVGVSETGEAENR